MSLSTSPPNPSKKTTQDLTTQQETIAAITTAIGRAGVGIVRLSGKHAKTIGERICRLSLKPRYAHFTSFYQGDTVVDQGIAIYFNAPHSFTGEDVVELQAHGGGILLNSLLNTTFNLGARQARPGEFSERAFLNNKIDLAQAEAIADLIDASSETAARNAMNSLQGNFSKRIHALVEKTIQLRIYIEAAIDFPEEEIDFLQDTYIKESFLQLENALTHIISQAKQGSLLKEGIKVVILGKPNAGKSSLLNALAEKDTAIVTAIQGTTRDLLREHVLIDDLPIHLIDTAGLRQSSDEVEQEGIRRAIAEIALADLVILVNDASEQSTDNIQILLEDVKPLAVEQLSNIPCILVHNKADLINKSPEHIQHEQQDIIYLSAKKNVGVDLLKQSIKKFANYQDINQAVDSQEGLFSARQRHQQALKQALNYLHSGKKQLDHYQAGELVAEDLRQCQYHLSSITGEFTSDDLLGEIFSSFCIGK